MVDAVLIGLGVIAIAIGAVLYAVQLRQGLRADASKKWPRASATVTASAVEKSPGHRWRYSAALQYSYRVGGKDYQSSRVFWGGNEGRQKHMASVVERPPGRRQGPRLLRSRQPRRSGARSDPAAPARGRLLSMPWR